MARKRMISPSMWESESFSELNDLAKLVFISMISHADDEGRGKANPAYIRSMTFPNDDSKRVADIEKALSEIGCKMSVQFYSVDGRDYYFMTNWTEYQKIDKPTKSKLPPPPNVGVGGGIPNRGQFGEDSGSIRGVVGEDSTPNISKVNISKDNINVVVGLSDNDYTDLCNKIGKENCDYYIERVKAFKERNPQATFDVKTIILKWCREDKAKSGEADKGATVMSADEINAAFKKLNEEL